MSGARNGLGPYLLVVLGLVCRGCFGGLWTSGLVSSSPPSPHSPVQLLPGGEEP